MYFMNKSQHISDIKLDLKVFGAVNNDQGYMSVSFIVHDLLETNGRELIVREDSDRGENSTFEKVLL